MLMFQIRSAPIAGLLTIALLLTMSAGSLAGGRPLTADLTGAAVLPGPGDPDGSGTATLWLNQGQGTICWQVTSADVQLPIEPRLYEGTAGTTGGFVAILFPDGCGSFDRALIKAIREDPSGYYIQANDVGGPYPGGAIRGQLHK